MAQRLSSRPRRVLFNKCVQLCWTRGAGISGGRELGKQDSEAVRLVRTAWPGAASARKGEVPVWTRRVKWNQSEQVVPLAEPRGTSHAFFLLLVLTSLRETLHPVFVVLTLSSGPNPFGSTNLRSALSKSNAELERWPWRSSASLGVPVAPAHAEPPAPSAEVRPVPHVVAKTNSFSTDLKQALVFFLNLVTTNWFTGGIRQRF